MRPNDIDDQKIKESPARLDAAGEGHTDTVKVLLARGADVDAEDNKGRKALMGKKKGYKEIVRMLKEPGAKE